MNTAKYWTGDIGNCDICSIALRKNGEFFDARTYQGPWATICQSCFTQHSPAKLGVGAGQHYQAMKDGRWMKVEG